MQKDKPTHLIKPDWLKVKLPNAFEYAHLKQELNANKLHTICESGKCPNIGECWKAGTATFMILGDICTRSCKFCAVKKGKPFPPDINEPERVAAAVKTMNIKHCVLTSVDRDDLTDGGATIWAQTIKAIKNISEGITIECLIPDFKGNEANLQQIIDTKPEIISHNLETVKRLTKEIRVYASYERSLEVLKYINKKNITSKSGIMLGLGETEEEIFETMDDLLAVGCKILTVGQYLQPHYQNFPVQKYISPEKFNEYKILALKKGFIHAESAPLVRSSYHAEKHI